MANSTDKHNVRRQAVAVALDAWGDKLSPQDLTSLRALATWNDTALLRLVTPKNSALHGALDDFERALAKDGLVGGHLSPGSEDVAGKGTRP